MHEKEIEEEIEKRVAKEMAKRAFLSDVKKALLKYISGGELNTKEVIAFLTDFTVQGYIVAHGCNEDGELFFNAAIDKSWNSCKKEYQQENGEAEIEDDDLVSLKVIIKELHERMR